MLEQVATEVEYKALVDSGVHVLMQHRHCVAHDHEYEARQRRDQ